MSSTILNEEHRSTLIKECLTTCKSVIDGGTGIVEGSRILYSLGRDLGLQHDPTFISFLGVDSQSDHFPIGPVRDQWAADALAREDRSREEFENDFRESIIADCQKVIRMFGGGAA